MAFIGYLGSFHLGYHYITHMFICVMTCTITCHRYIYYTALCIIMYVNSIIVRWTFTYMYIRHRSWTVKKAECRRIDAFELWCWRRLLRVPCTAKEIQPVHSEGDQPRDFFGRNDAKAETPVLWPSHAKSWLTGKHSDAGRDWGQEEKGTTEDEMAGWHHRLDGRESEWTVGVGDGQGGLACCNSWGRKESDTTEWLNWTELNVSFHVTLSTPSPPLSPCL